MTNKLVTLSLMASAALCAAVPQSPVNTGDILRQVEPVKLPMEEKAIPSFIQRDSNISTQQPQQPKIRQETEIPVSPQEAKIKSDSMETEAVREESHTVTIQKFLFRGNIAFKADELRKVIVTYNNRELNAQLLLDAANEVTAYYRKKGFINARAYIYKKDIHDDTLTITITAKNHNEILNDPGLLKITDELNNHKPPISPSTAPAEKETHHDVQNTTTSQSRSPLQPSESKVNVTEKVKSTFFVKGFNFNGNTAFDSKTLSERVKSYEEKEYSIDALKQVASVITKYYRDRGYFVARAYIPAQSMEDGIVEIAIIEGAYEAFDMKNSSLVDTDEVQGYMDHLNQGQIVSTMSLERQMLLINDLSGGQVTNAEVYPGKAVGTSDFRITVAPTDKYTGYAIIDNYGSRYTGENRLSVGGYFNSFTGIGDTLSLSTLVSNTADLKNGRIGYDRPLGYSGLKGGASISVTDYRLEEIKNYEAFGRTNSYNGYIAYPILKTRAHTQTLRLDYDHKDMKETGGIPGLVEESKKQLDALSFKAIDTRNTSLANLPGKLNASAGYTIGHLGLKNDNARSTDEAGLNAGGNYTKLTLNAFHNQYLREDTTLQSTFKAQKSFGKNLDSSEDLSVGGSNGVRAYEDSELSGDQGYALSLDLVYNLPQVAMLNHTASIFLDHAKVWKNDTTFNAEDNIRTLNAIGLGYGMNYQNFDLKATLAHGFGEERTPTTEAEFHTHSNKLLIQGMMRF